MKILHITAASKIISKYRNIPKMPVADVKAEIERLAHGAPLELDQKIVAELERVTQMKIKDLAKLSKEWP